MDKWPGQTISCNVTTKFILNRNVYLPVALCNSNFALFYKLLLHTRFCTLRTQDI